MGHLQSDDGIAKQILCNLSHLQLQVRSSTPVLALHYTKYHKWIDHTWLTSIWQFLNSIKATLEIERQWIPQVCREHDQMLMDIALTLHFTPPQLASINYCRMHLQVLTVSDITAADGISLLSSSWRGVQDPSRVSNLHWPVIPRPKDWASWTLLLQHISTGSKLTRPLGRWTQYPHQQWTWFKHITHPTLYRRDIAEDVWFCYTGTESLQARHTRQTLVQYSDPIPCSLPPHPDILLPSTTTYIGDTLSTTPSSSIFPFPPSPIPSGIWKTCNVSLIFADTPTFFQRLIGADPPTTEDCSTIAEEIRLSTFLACSDGSHNPTLAIASHSWVFGNGLQQILASGAGPDDGHPRLLSSYRSELGGILSVLYIVHRICQSYNISAGKVVLYCDNKGALRNAFKDNPPGISPTSAADYDILRLARRYIQLIPVSISGEWVKGHYNGKDKAFKHEMNDLADSLANEHMSNQQAPFKTLRCPLPYPDYRARLVVDKSVVTSKLNLTIYTAVHEHNIIQHILKKTNWTQAQFSSVNFNAFEQAYKRLSRQQRISTSKLIFTLANTNRQNNLYYGSSSLCPGCKTTEETFEHVLICPFPPTQAARSIHLSDLQRTLRSINTPALIISTIIQGFSHWFQPPAYRSRAPTFGSLHPPDILLTQAYYEQFYQLSWYQFSLGRISQKWTKALVAYDSVMTITRDSDFWASSLISSLWKFTRNMWNYRNQLVHGASVEENVNIIRAQLHSAVSDHYAASADNPDYVLPRHSYLFTTRTQAQRLQYSHDNIRCWLRSVNEARAILSFQQAQLQETSRRVFGILNPASVQESPETSSKDSSYTPPSTSYATSTTATTSVTTLSLSPDDTDLSATSHSSISCSASDDSSSCSSASFTSIPLLSFVV